MVNCISACRLFCAEIGPVFTSALTHQEPCRMTQEAIHKRNLESSILFMQQEHAATLKALHEEIQKLQKKCTGNNKNSSFKACSCGTEN